MTLAPINTKRAQGTTSGFVLRLGRESLGTGETYRSFGLSEFYVCTTQMKSNAVMHDQESGVLHVS